MKEVAQPVINEAAKYGLAILVLTVMLVFAITAIVIMWRYIVSEGKLNREALLENTQAFMELKHSIDLLTAKIK